MDTKSLPDIIRQHVHLPNRVNSRGWYPVVCKVCNDHIKKGIRAGFKLDGPIVGYNCFNCGHSAVFDPAESRKIPQDMVKVLDAFGVPKADWEEAQLDALLHTYQNSSDTSYQLNPDTISVPPFFYPLSDDKNDEWCQESIYYLTSRGVDWTSYPFYCVKKTSHPDNHRWYGRLIIPIFKDNNLIFYQGRDLTDTMVKKYLNLNIPRDNIIFGYDQIAAYSQTPLYVVEGWFDAFLIDGVAVFSNKLTQPQITWLNRTSRPKVIIPDRYGDGHLLANQALQLGWKISHLDLNDTSKDVNESIIKNGLIYTMKTLVDNTSMGDIGQIRINLYCKRNKQ